MTANNTPSLREQAITCATKRILADYFAKTCIQLDTWKPNPARGSVFQAVHDKVKKMDFGGIDPRVYMSHVEASLNIATMAYGHTHPAVQVHVTMFTILTICIDDINMEPRALEEFAQRFFTGNRQLHPILDYLVENLRDLHRFYLPYACSAIVSSTVNFVSGTLLDKQAQDAHIAPKTEQYVAYKRERNGLAEAYGFMIWDKFDFPDLMTHLQVIPEAIFYLNHVNDILSFYKEEISEDTCTFIHDRAMVTGQDVSEVTLWLVQQIADSVNRARSLLRGEKEKQCWERFIAGYAAFHFSSSRYRLTELTGSQYLAVNCF